MGQYERMNVLTRSKLLALSHWLEPKPMGKGITDVFQIQHLAVQSEKMEKVFACREGSQYSNGNKT